MSVQDIVTIIQGVGFPIVMCGAMAYYVKYITDKNRESMNDLNERHTNEINQISHAINNNTMALQHLSDIIDKDN